VTIKHFVRKIAIIDEYNGKAKKISP
jgi:hypothetical protein